MAVGRFGHGQTGRSHGTLTQISPPPYVPPSSYYTLPAERSTLWSGAGIPGGIPVYSVIYTIINAATYTGVDASAGIQAALNACPVGQVVLLSAGTFIINNLLLISKGIVLRGAGATSTILTKTNGARARTDATHPIDPTSYVYDAQPVIIVGPQRWCSYDDTTSKALTSDGVKGAYTVTVTDASGFAAGHCVVLDELSGATLQATPAGFPGAAQVWQGDRVAWNIHSPVQQYLDDPPEAKAWFCRQDRPTAEVKEIASIAGNVITFTTPLHISYRTSHTAQLTNSTGANVYVKGAGVESMKLIGGADGQLRFTHAARCWAKNIDNTQYIGESVAIDASLQIELRESYLHEGSWPEPGGAGYAISSTFGSAEFKVENCTIIDHCKTMVARCSGAGSVYGYNYCDIAWDFDTPTWQEVHLNASHMAGPHHVLFEGNDAPNYDSDYTHGNSIDMTIFRNRLSGQRRAPFVDSANPRCAGAAYGSWRHSFIGNILGTAGNMGAWNYEPTNMNGISTGQSGWSGPNLWMAGYDPERWNMTADPLVLSTLIRDGNYDHKNSVQTWHNSAPIALPDSMYLSSKPAFFGSKAWPWVNPATGVVTQLPARLRYDNGTPNDTTPP